MNQEPTHTDSPSPLDPARLEKLRELQKATGRDILTQVIDLYRDDTPGRVDSIRRALAEGSAGDAERLAHSIKGSSANIGAQVVMELATEIEADLSRGSTAGLDEKLARLESEIDRVCRALEELRPG